MQADLERRFGGLRRLYGDAGYERLRAARVAVVGLGGVGSWAAEALARSGVARADADRPGPRRRVATSTARCRRSAARWARPRCWRCASAWPTSTPAARCTAVEEFVDARQLAGAAADAAWTRSSMPATRCAPRRRMAAWALAERACLRDRSARPAASAVAQAVDVDDLAEVTHDPLLAALRQRLRKRARRRAPGPHRRCAACSRARPWPRRCRLRACERQRRHPQLPRLRLQRHRDRDLRHGRRPARPSRNCCRAPSSERPRPPAIIPRLYWTGC